MSRMRLRHSGGCAPGHNSALRRTKFNGREPVIPGSANSARYRIRLLLRVVVRVSLTQSQGSSQEKEYTPMVKQSDIKFMPNVIDVKFLCNSALELASMYKNLAIPSQEYKQ